MVFFHSSTLTCSGPSSFVIRALLWWTEREGEGREGGGRRGEERERKIGEEKAGRERERNRRRREGCNRKRG